MSNKTVAAVIAIMSIFVAHNASADDKLFKGYAYDSPATEYTVAKGYYDCSESVGGNAMCLDNVEFLEKKFTAALIFSDSKLTQVSLVTPFEQSTFTGAMATLAKSFSLVSLTDAKTILDVVELAAKARSQEDFTAKLTNYETVGLSSGNMTYTFLEGVGPIKGHSTAVSMLSTSAINTRSADLMLSGEGVNSSLIIRFTFPRLEEQKLLQAAKKPAESF